jgi:hypothetical protein
MSKQSEKTRVLSGSTNPESLITEIPERRRASRYSFIATAEVVELRSQTRVSGRCSDLSMGGCYVDTLAPFSLGSVLRISIRHDSRAFTANAVVAYAHPSMGMGITFTEIKNESRAILQYWVADLSGEPIAEPECSKAPPVVDLSAADSDSNTRLVVSELITLLVRKKIITEMEGAELLIHTFR